MLRLLLAAGIVAASLAGGAVAMHYCQAPPVVDVAGQAYLVVDEIYAVYPAHGEYLFSIWAYVESNGEPGLQRGGCAMLGDCDPCQNSSNPDTWIF